jgi:hypothetical protein
MFWEYIKEIADASWEFAKGGGELIEIIIFGLVFFIPKYFEKHEKRGIKNEKSVRKILVHKFVTNDMWRAAVVFMGFFCFHVLMIAPYKIYHKQSATVDEQASEIASLKLAAKKNSPILHGRIEEMAHTDEINGSQWVYIEMSIKNEGSQTMVEGYDLTIQYNGDQKLFQPARIPMELHQTNVHSNAEIDLHEPEALYEKTAVPIVSGGMARGWLSYRLAGFNWMANTNPSNVYIISFSDAVGRIYRVTNTPPITDQLQYFPGTEMGFQIISTNQ